MLDNPFVTHSWTGRTSIRTGRITILAIVTAAGVDLATRGKDSIIGRGFTAVTTKSANDRPFQGLATQVVAKVDEAAKDAKIQVVETVFANAMGQAIQALTNPGLQAPANS